MTSTTTSVKNTLLATKWAPKEHDAADRYDLDPTSDYVLELFACDHEGHVDGIWVCYQIDADTPIARPTGTNNMSYHDRVPISNSTQVQVWAGGDDVDRNGKVFYTLYQTS